MGRWWRSRASTDGNPDVFVVPAAGGVPKRLTFHPGEDDVLGWTPDGKSVLFSSWGSSFLHFENQVYTVPLAGGLPVRLPVPIAAEAAYSPDGSQLAYVPHDQWQAAWKRYRGGPDHPRSGSPTWPTRRSPKCRETTPTTTTPCGSGDTIYFLSDRNGPVSLFAYDTKSESGVRGPRQRRSRLQDRVSRARRHRHRAVRRHQALRPDDPSGDDGADSGHRATSTPCVRTSRRSIQNGSRTSGCRRSALAPSSRPGARSSPSPPTRATSAI